MHKVVAFTLSTCGWCKKTKRFLDENDVVYENTEVDLLEGEERKRVLAEVKRWNPRQSFPTVVVDDKEVVVGYDEGKLRKALGL